MSRAGREPAEDVKRRMIAACEEVGLSVKETFARLMPDASVRVIHIAACPPLWPHDLCPLTLLAFVGTDGRWSETVRITCCATEDDPLAQVFSAPVMQGRDEVPLRSLVGELESTLRERAEVISRNKVGDPGPFTFGRVIWRVPELLL